MQLTDKKTFYILRHGETYFSKNSIPYGKEVFRAKILDEGVPAIVSQANYLKDKNITLWLRSQMTRCVQTGQIITKVTNQEFTEEKRLNEMTEDSFADFRKRMVDLLEDLKTKEENNICLLTHGAGIAALKHLLLKGEFKGYELYDYPKTGIITIVSGGEVKEVNFNE